MYLDEIFFLMNVVDVNSLKEARDILASAEALEFRIYRDPKVLTCNVKLQFEFLLV